MEVLPVNKNAEYIKHLSLVILGWLTVTLIVGFGMALFALS